MEQLFFGFLLAALDINLSFGRHTIDFLPDFVVYYFVLCGLQELSERSKWFAKGMFVTKLLAAYAAVCWIFAAIFGMYYPMLLVNMAADIGGLYVLCRIVQGIRALEEETGAAMRSRELSALWKGLAAVTVIQMPLRAAIAAVEYQVVRRSVYNLFLLTQSAITIWVVVLCSVAALVMMVLLLVWLYQGWHALEAAQAESAAADVPAEAEEAADGEGEPVEEDAAPEDTEE